MHRDFSSRPLLFLSVGLAAAIAVALAGWLRFPWLAKGLLAAAKGLGWLALACVVLLVMTALTPPGEHD